MSSVRQNLRDGLLLVSDTAFGAFSGGAPRVDGGVLLMRLDGIGDFFLWLSSARAIRDAYAGTHITLLADTAFSEFAAGLDLFDEVIPIDRHRLAHDLVYRYDVFRRIRGTRYDIAILPSYYRIGRFRDGEALMRAARATRKVGSIGGYEDSWRHRVSRTWYTDLLPAREGDLHEFERNEEFIRGLSIEMQQDGSPMDRPPSAAAQSTAAQSTAENAYFVLVPGAGSPLRRWPAAHFALLAERISHRTGWKGVLCGGPSDTSLAAEIQRLSSVELQDSVGRLSLAESVELIRDARIVVGNETGAIHIAAFVRTPAVSITGGGHYGRFVPYPEGMSGPAAASVHMPCFHCDWQCIYPVGDHDPAPCVAGIPVESVWLQVEGLLRASGERYDLREVGAY